MKIRDFYPGIEVTLRLRFIFSQLPSKRQVRPTSEDGNFFFFMLFCGTKIQITLNK